MTVEYYNTATSAWVDISSYFDEIELNIELDLSKSHIAKYQGFTISLPSSLSAIQEDTVLRYKDGTTTIFTGVCSLVEKDHKYSKMRIDVKPCIEKLKKFYFDQSLTLSANLTYKQLLEKYLTSTQYGTDYFPSYTVSGKDTTANTVLGTTAYYYPKLYGDIIKGSDGNYYACKKEHTSSSATKPTTGASYSDYWMSASAPTYDAWSLGTKYTKCTWVVGSDSKVYKCIRAHTGTTYEKPITGAVWTDYWELADTISGDDWESGKDYARATYNDFLFDILLAMNGDDISSKTLFFIVNVLDGELGFYTIDSTNEGTLLDSSKLIEAYTSVKKTYIYKAMQNAFFCKTRCIGENRFSNFYNYKFSVVKHKIKTVEKLNMFKMYEYSTDLKGFITAVRTDGRIYNYTLTDITYES